MKPQYGANQPMLSRPTLAILFCCMVLAAGLASLYSSPSTSSSIGRTAPSLSKTEGGITFDEAQELETEEEEETNFGEEDSQQEGDDVDDTIVQGENAPQDNLVSGDAEDGSMMQDDSEEARQEQNALFDNTQKEEGAQSKEDEEEPQQPVEIDTNQDICKTSRLKEHPGIVGGPRVQYVHLPKTGGTSVQLELFSTVQNTKLKAYALRFNGPSVHGSSFNCPPHATDATVLMGHRGWGFCNGVEKSGRGLVTFATLRGAVSRIISLFDYNLARRAGRSVRVFGAIPLEVLVKRYNRTAELEEGEQLLRFSGSQQVRFMCGYECMGPNAAKNATINLPFMMQRAKENLLRTDIIGITEELNDCIPQLKFHLPFIRNRLHEWPEANEIAIRKKSDPDDQARAILTEWGKPDEELYQFAKILYEKKKAIVKACMKHP